jgi:hypothetical protein
MAALLVAAAAAVSPSPSLAAPATSPGPPVSAAPVTVTFRATGDFQQWTVPAGVTTATFDLYGGQGTDLYTPQVGRSSGLGGRATATLGVTPGDVVTVAVGQYGGPRFGPAPFGGGGLGRDGGNGGGASDIRIGGTGLASRVLVAGGGGGVGNCAEALGGAGGGLEGQPGVLTSPCPFSGSDDVAGGGGTPEAGGSAASADLEGRFGRGGSGPAQSPSLDDSGGGGGGWFGGGAGAFGGPGGGGSGHGPAGTLFETGVRSGDGLVTVTYTPAVAVPPADTTSPQTALSKAPKHRVRTSVAVFRFTSTEPGSRFECSVDFKRFKPCSSPTRKRVSPGPHAFAVRAVDAAGNVDPTPATVRWTFVRRP